MKSRPRRNLLQALCLVGAVFGPAAPQAHAQAAFPAKAVTITTAFAPGSGPDAVLRMVAERLSRQWNQQVVVNNKPGGGGFIAMESVRRLPADGYNLLQLDSEHLAAVPHLYKSRNFVTLQVFDPVATLFRTPFFITVATDSKWQNLKDLVEAARAAPGKVSYGSWGIGSPGHLGGEELELLSGTEMNHIAFREVSQLYTSVGSGDIQWAYASIPSSAGVFKAGKIRYIAIAAPRRVPQLPDVPTVAESGGPKSLDVNSFVVLVAPKGVPADVAARINADVQKALADPEIKARFNTFAFETLSWSPEEIRRQADAKGRTYGKLVERKSISLE